MWEQRAVFFNWPMAGPGHGHDVRWFAFGPFIIIQQGALWQVRDPRKIDGKHAFGAFKDFDSKAAAEEFMRAEIAGA